MLDASAGQALLGLGGSGAGLTDQHYLAVQAFGELPGVLLQSLSGHGGARVAQVASGNYVLACEQSGRLRYGPGVGHLLGYARVSAAE